MPAFAAVDLGAESGRVIRGDLKRGRLVIREAARFATGLKMRDGHLRWDLPRFLAEIEKELTRSDATEQRWDEASLNDLIEFILFNFHRPLDEEYHF